MYQTVCGKTFCHIKPKYICQVPVVQINVQVCKTTWQYLKSFEQTVLKRTPAVSKLETPALYIPRNKYEEILMSSPHAHYSTAVDNPPKSEPSDLSKKDKLKKAVKDYGSTVIIFHITISLMSLGISYLVISSGVDVASLLEKVGVNAGGDITTEAGTFVVAYAVHKMFAPVRISITLGATPFIVRYLRRVGILKPPKTGP